MMMMMMLEQIMVCLRTLLVFRRQLRSNFSAGSREVIFQQAAEQQFSSRTWIFRRIAPHDRAQAQKQISTRFQVRGLQSKRNTSSARRGNTGHFSHFFEKTCPL